MRNYNPRPRLNNVETKNLKHIIAHRKSRKLDYVFEDAEREIIIADYSDAKAESFRVQVWNLIYRYADLTGKELEIFKVED